MHALFIFYIKMYYNAFKCMIYLYTISYCSYLTLATFHSGGGVVAGASFSNSYCSINWPVVVQKLKRRIAFKSTRHLLHFDKLFIPL